MSLVLNEEQELLQDSATLLLPVTRDDIARAIAKLRVATLLEGHRGGPPGDVEALTETTLWLKHQFHRRITNLPGR